MKPNDVVPVVASSNNESLELFLGRFRSVGGVAVDDGGTVFLNTLYAPQGGLNIYSIIVKASQSGDSSSNLVAQNIAKQLSTIHLAKLPDSRKMIGVRESDGALLLVDVDTLEVAFLRNLILSKLSVVSSKYYNLTSRSGRPVRPISLQSASYGDIAVRASNGGYDLFVTGANALGSVPFVVRLKTDGNLSKFLDIDILIGGEDGLPRRPDIPRIPSPIRRPPGIAINALGQVLTSLPSWAGGDIYSNHNLVLFPADFEPGLGQKPATPGNYYGVESYGMTSDGYYFYVIENDPASSHRALVIPPSFQSPVQIQKLPGVLSNRDEYANGDIAVDPTSAFAYLSHPSADFVSPPTLGDAYILRFRRSLPVQPIMGTERNEVLVGTSGNDVIIALGGNDLINGLAGNDNLIGGTGNDTFIIDAAADQVNEQANQGKDTVQSSTTWALGPNVENLKLTGLSPINGFGNSLNNTIIGNTAANTLKGGAGADLLTGMDGVDRFVMDTSTSADTITDFRSSNDYLLIKQAGIPIGNNDATINGAVVRGGAGGFTKGTELVIFTANIGGSITTTKASAKIGSANKGYAKADRRLFAVDNGTSSALFLFTSSGNDSLVSAAELRLLATLQGTNAMQVQDIKFLL